MIEETVARWQQWPGWSDPGGRRPFNPEFSARWLAWFTATGVYPRGDQCWQPPPRPRVPATRLASPAIAIDATATDALPVTTGVERVVRALLAHLREHPSPQTVVVRWRDRGRVLTGFTPELPASGRGMVGRAAANPALVATLFGLGLGEAVKRAHARAVLHPTAQGEPRLLPDDTTLLLPETTALRSPEQFARLHALAAATPVRLVPLIHDMYPLTHPTRSSPATRAALAAMLPLLPLADRVLASSDQTASDIAALAPGPCRIEVIRLAVDLPPMADRPNPPGSKAPDDIPPGGPSSPGRNTSAPPVVLTVGALEPRKNIAALVAAATLLWQRGLVFTLTIVGSARGADRAATAAVSAARKAGWPISMETNLSDAQLRERYAAARVYVQPSLFEGYGLPVLESIAAGTPAIAADTGIAGQFVGHGVTLCDTRDVNAIAAALDRLLTDDVHWTAERRATRTAPMRTWPEFSAALLTSLRPSSDAV